MQHSHIFTKGEYIQLRPDIIIFIRRFLELFLTNFIISSLITILYLAEILNTTNSITLALILGTVIFFAINIRMLKFCYYDMRRYTRMYYIVNTAAYLVFAFVGFAIYLSGKNVLYTWLFATTKFVKFTIDGVANPHSALLFHLIGLASVFLTPIVMKIIGELND